MIGQLGFMAGPWIERGLKREITIGREFMWCGVYSRWVIECVMFSKVGNVFRSIGLV